ncbi:MAG: hypothetical protein M4D85_03515 [Actinomycetota bacterium]|nr:hypothetical protein [Actinomycetota bacterium]
MTRPSASSQADGYGMARSRCLAAYIAVSAACIRSSASRASPVESHTDAGGHGEVDTCDADGGVQHRLQPFLDGLDAPIELAGITRQALAQQHELVTGQPGQGVTVAQGGGPASGHLAQHASPPAWPNM